MKTFLHLLKLVRPYAKEVLLAALLGTGTMLSSVALIATSAFLISAAALQPSIASLQVAIVGVRFFGISRGVFRYLERLVSHGLNLRLVGHFRSWFYRVIEPLAPAGISQYSSGDLLDRMVGDVEALKDYYVRVLAPPLVALVTVSVWEFFLVFYDFTLVVGLLVFYILLGLVIPLLVHQLGQKSSVAQVNNWAELNHRWVEGLQGMAEVQANNRVGLNLADMAAVIDQAARLQRQKAVVNALRSALSLLVSNGGMWLMLFLAIPLVTKGDLNGVMLAVVVLGSLASFEGMLPIPIAAEHLQKNLQSAGRLFEVSALTLPVKEPEQPKQIRSPIELLIKDLTFSYGEGTEPVLQSVGIELPFGKKVAVVGTSGAGKSTMINLILRFWEVRPGSIQINDLDIHEYDGDEIRKRMAVVSQATYLFGGTLRQNLLLAKPGAGEADLIDAIEKAGLAEFLNQLPLGLDTWVGEHGLTMSAGQRQRVALARAFLKDAPLLLLDEPTANLDALTEKNILDTVLEQPKRQSVLLVTHRLVGLERVDEILVLQGGVVVQHGSQDELLSEDGVYKKLYSLQNQNIYE